MSIIDSKWCFAQIDAWWAALRIPKARRWQVLNIELLGYAKQCALMNEPGAAEAASHHIATIAMSSQAECPGDPMLGFRKSVQAYLFGKQQPQQKEATAVAKKKPAVESASKPAKDVVRIPCEFTGLAPGKEEYSLGVRFSRKKFSLKDADRLLCGARLNVRLVKDGNVDLDGPNQQTFNENPEDEDVITSVVDAKGYNAKPKAFTTRLSFSAEEIDKAQMLEFIDEKGYVELERVGDMEEKKRGRPKKDDGDEHQQTFEGGE